VSGTVVSLADNEMATEQRLLQFMARETTHQTTNDCIISASQPRMD